MPYVEALCFKAEPETNSALTRCYTFVVKIDVLGKVFSGWHSQDQFVPETDVE